MSKYVDELNFKNLIKESLLDAIKRIFDNGEKTVSEYDNIEKSYKFRYQTKIKDLEVIVEVIVFLSDDNDCLKRIEVLCDDERISNLDLESYYRMGIYAELSKALIRKSEDNYCIRVYKYILTDIGFKGIYTVNFGRSKITFKPLLDIDKKVVITERIIAFDCTVSASTIEAARSKAINTINEFSVYLSVLIDVGFFDIQSKFINVLYTKTTEDGQGIYHKYYPRGFFDKELNLCVRDNMNGLFCVKDLENYKSFQYSFVAFGDKAYINNERNISSELENIFKNRKIETANNKLNKFSDCISEEILYNCEITIPKDINLYFKGILNLEIEARKLFFNSCKLYNISKTCGTYEPTLQISYMVSCIDCLIKVDEKLLNKENRKKGEKKEKKSYSSFMKEYLDEDYDKELCDFLYDNIRCGHFHSGESYFNEYEVDLDLTFNTKFQNLLNKFREGENLLRKAIVRWINRNIIKN